MAIANKWDSIDASILKECYDLAIQYENLDIAKDVLRDKAHKIVLTTECLSRQDVETFNETEMQIISEAIYSLSLEGFTASEKDGFKYAYRINDLPSSAEKEYVLALLALRNGTNETHRLEAIRHIEVAHHYSPNDPRYNALARVLQDVDL